jgi:dienelactone hydrolase/NTP pyrophosphatase (non-canonical NTP hydrolase)
MTTGTAKPALRLDVTPLRAPMDADLTVRVLGAPPSAQVTVTACSTDAAGLGWRSGATFAADEHGTVNLHRDPPQARSSYSGVDPMGLIWSMCPAGPANPQAARDRLAPQSLVLTAEAAGTSAAFAEVTRLCVPDGLTRTDVGERGLVGVLYRPAGDRPLPSVLMLGGAEGGLHEDNAALLAAHGYVVLALGYYGMPGLPQTLTSIPVEYFATALSYLADRADVTAGRIAVHGGSKGGEAALLIGSIYPAVRAVVSIVGGGLVTQGISQDVETGSLLEILRTPVPNWTYQGRELPYLPNVVTPRMEAAVAAGGPVSLGWAAPDLSDAAKVAEAAIPVERIAGPVLLISGADDQTYGPAFQEAAAQRLAAARHPYPFRHVVHEGAGHLIAAPPYRPTTQSVFPGPGVPFQYGGTPAADAAARLATWHETLRFLDQALHSRIPSTREARPDRSMRLEPMTTDQASAQLLQQTIEDVERLVARHGWESTPRRRMAMLLGEAIELADEILQLPAEGDGDNESLQRVGHEMYDVLWNLCDLARLTGVDLVQAAADKRLINEHRTWPDRTPADDATSNSEPSGHQP